ncbi:HAD-IA family hydrolase [Candidatus Woesearchaeota archaeon]|nr:HAD-IA family hydrolase [Candidatus Woesearchaeota archaeon]
MDAVIFDFDGTLVDSCRLVVECTNSLSEKYNFSPIQDSEILKKKSLEELFSEINLEQHQLLLFLKDMKSLFMSRLREIQFHPDILSVLEKLSREKQLFILTSSSPSVVKYVLEKHKGNYFKSIYGDSSLFGKEESIAKLLRERGLDRSQAVYVGDEVRDIKACRKAGIKIIAVSWGFNSRELLEGSNPDFLIDQPDELLGLLSPKTI